MGQEILQNSGLDQQIVALSLQQPWAELILQGKKTIELRTFQTNRRGQIYLYAGKSFSRHSHAKDCLSHYNLEPVKLCFGRLVGQVTLTRCRPATDSDREQACFPMASYDGYWSWELTDPIRFETPVPVRFKPYGPWFYPFQRINSAVSG